MGRLRAGVRTLTTRQLSAAHPFAAGRLLDPGGVLIGRDLVAGRPFAIDPWRLYAAGAITSPGTLVAGQVGRGKSALIKTYVARQLLWGRRAVVIDPKGEYGSLAAWCGTTPIRLRPGGGTRLNPLDPAIAADRRADLAAAILGQALGRRLEPVERGALTRFVRVHGDATPTLPVLQAMLANPDAALAATLGTDARQLAVELRPCAVELRGLLEGALAGLMDGPTSPDVRLDAPVVVFDLSGLGQSAVLGLVMACITAWHEALPPHSGGRILVIDEAWALVAQSATAEFFQRSWKLARAAGIQNILVVHRISDLAAAADAGSRIARLAEGLVSDSELCVLFGHPHADIAIARERLGLSDTEVELIARLPRGSALWRVGGRSFAVEHLVSAQERGLVDTDAAMRSAHR
jgi:type IV secretory pathway VirB4 component